MTWINRSLRLTWVVVRFPVLSILALCEPIAAFALTSLALMCVLCAGLGALVAPFRGLPAWGLLGCAVGLLALRSLYRVTVRLLSA